MVQVSGQIPKLIGSYKRSETVLIASSHILLRPTSKLRLSFEKAYSFSKSTKNQSIEARLNLCTDGQIDSWKQYFNCLEQENSFYEDSIDIACLQFIYMDMICIHTQRLVYVATSNCYAKNVNMILHLLTFIIPTLFENKQNVITTRQLANLSKCIYIPYSESTMHHLLISQI